MLTKTLQGRSVVKLALRTQAGVVAMFSVCDALNTLRTAVMFTCWGEKVGREGAKRRWGEKVGREGGERRWGEKVGREGGERWEEKVGREGGERGREGR